VNKVFIKWISNRPGQHFFFFGVDVTWQLERRGVQAAKQHRFSETGFLMRVSLFE
jgi:hypothetical protein